MPSVNSIFVLLVFAGTLCNAAPQKVPDSAPYEDDVSLGIKDRVRRKSILSNYSWRSAVNREVDCGNPGRPSFGTSLYTFTKVLAIAVHICNPGYRLEGAKFRQCLPNGSWTPELPKCFPVDCGDPGYPINGNKWMLSTLLSAMVKYKCNTGFTLIGDRFRTCQVDGKWSGDLPSCQRVVNECSISGAPQQGQVYVNGRSPGDHAWYICNHGFSLQGSGDRVCQSNGEWSTEEPICNRQKCEIFRPLRNGHISFYGSTPGSKAVHSCYPGFELVGQETRTCQLDGLWSGNTPFCKKVKCTMLTIPENGRVALIGIHFGDTATYSCLAGFDLQGTQLRTCGANGKWNLQAPVCIAVDCEPLQSPQNGEVFLTGTLFCSTARYTCDPSFRLLGELERNCQADGQWSGDDPICQVIQCPDLRPNSNTTIGIAGTGFTDTATYGCDSGFNLVGEATRTCQVNGTWSGTPPFCSRVDCGILTPPKNGNISYSQGTLHESVTTYSCEPPFQIKGMTTRVCQDNGNWSRNEPTCEGPEDCGDPGIPTNGRRNGDDFRFRATVHYECNVNFQLMGSSSRLCQQSGLWDGSLPICFPIRGSDSCSNNGTTVYDNCDQRCTCVNGQFVDCCRVRADFSSLSQKDKHRLISAMITISSDWEIKPRYDALVALYRSSFETLAQSTNPTVSQFLPWNRFALIQYENLLREVDCEITLPYWDWTALPLNPYFAPVFSPKTGFGDSSRANDTCVSNGPFNFTAFEITPSAGGGCLQRQYRMQMFPTRAIIERDLLTLPEDSFIQFHQLLQIFVHTNVRCYVGGQMCSNDAANDPLYFLHLAQIDFIFDRWQRVDSSHVHFVDDDRSLSLSRNFSVSQFARNEKLANDVCVIYDTPQFKNHLPPSMKFLTEALQEVRNNHNLKMTVIKDSGILMDSSAKEVMQKMCFRKNFH